MGEWHPHTMFWIQSMSLGIYQFSLALCVSRQHLMNRNMWYRFKKKKKSFPDCLKHETECACVISLDRLISLNNIVEYY